MWRGVLCFFGFEGVFRRYVLYEHKQCSHLVLLAANLGTVQRTTVKKLNPPKKSAERELSTT